MNIRRIITEAINNTVMSQYAAKLKSIVGNSGISAKPVANNQAASEHIMALNRFVYLVLDAIQNGAYTNEDLQGSAGVPGVADSNGNYGFQNPYNDRTRNNFNSFNKGVGYLTNKAGELYDAVGLDKALNPIFGGAMGAFNKGRDDINNMTNNAMFQRDINRRYGNNGNGAAASNGSAGGGNVPRTLATLFNLDKYMFPSNPPMQYNQLCQQAAQINQQNNNILFSVQPVVECYKTLSNLRQETINIIKTRNTKNQQQPKPQQQQQPKPQQQPQQPQQRQQQQQQRQQQQPKPQQQPQQPQQRQQQQQQRQQQQPKPQQQPQQPQQRQQQQQQRQQQQPKPQQQPQQQSKPTNLKQKRGENARAQKVIQRHKKHVNELMMLDRNGDKFAYIVEKLEGYNLGDNNTKNFVIGTVKNIAELCDDCKEAIQNKSITSEDYQKTGVIPLQSLLDNNTSNYRLSYLYENYDKINGEFNDILKKITIIPQALRILADLKHDVSEMTNNNR